MERQNGRLLVSARSPAPEARILGLMAAGLLLLVGGAWLLDPAGTAAMLAAPLPIGLPGRGIALLLSLSGGYLAAAVLLTEGCSCRVYEHAVTGVALDRMGQPSLPFALGYHQIAGVHLVGGEIRIETACGCYRIRADCTREAAVEAIGARMAGEAARRRG